MLVHKALKEIDTHAELKVVDDGQGALDFLGQCVVDTPLHCPEVIL